MTDRSPPVDPLEAPVTELPGVGPKVAEKLARLRLITVQDVLFHLPLRYQDRTRIYPIGALREGGEVSIEGTIEHSEVVLRRRRMLLCRIADGTGAILLRFFNFSAQQQRALHAGVRIRCFGEARQGPVMLEMIHPEYQFVRAGEPLEVDAWLTPIYPTTEGVHQLTLRKLAAHAVERVGEVREWVPDAVRKRMGFPSLQEALRLLHRPPPETPVIQLADGGHPAQQRLAFEELLAHQLSLLKLRAAATRHAAPALDAEGDLTTRFIDGLPFTLTAAQRRVIAEIGADLRRPRPMLRLVQGDVGSGKTVVAAAAVLQAIQAGYQAVVMAPTEILAEQHYRNFRAWLDPLAVRVAWVSGKQRVAERRRMRAAIETGEAALAVGTHALFQDEVRFFNLALIVIDEQHRFGVHQRMALREKGEIRGNYPHQLIMTATPIPRTLAMTAYADLDLSVIDELPPGRRPVTTVAMGNDRRADVIARVAAACREGRQCYWVCTLVEESEALQCEAAEDTASHLQAALPDLSVGLVHGRMKPAEKEAAMTAFKEGGLDVLVATTVIEVGVDVPNASLMIIENAERLGLSQLHQLRGRVGRGSRQSHCVLLFQPPLSQHGRRRIQAMRETNDGFRIAQTDLELRGPGELLGTRQTGLMQFRIADIVRDKALIPAVSEAARLIVGRHPEAVEPLIARWIGDRTQYREV